MSTDEKKKRKNNHVALDLTKPIWIIMRQTAQTTVIEYAYDEDTARSVGNAMSAASGGTVVVFGPQAFTYEQPDVPMAVETPFQMPADDQPAT